MSNEDVEKLLFDTQRIYSESNKIKDKIIIMLIVLMFLEAVAGFAGFVWYESQFETVQTTEETETRDVDLSTSGDSADATYNDVSGDQYNDDAVHNEGGVD